MGLHGLNEFANLLKSYKKLSQGINCLFADNGLSISANNRKSAKLKNKHVGRIAILVGNGPSARIEDLETLGNEVTFCCNRFYLAYEKMSFRPMYTLSSDRQMIEDFGMEIVAKSQGIVFLISQKRPKIPGDFIWLRLKSRSPLVFSENIYDHVMPGGGTLITAIQIGYFMGITRYILYGVDHDFKLKRIEQEKDVFRSAYGDGNHFIKDYRSGKPWCPPAVRQIEESFEICDQFMRMRGGWVKNATRGGKLEVLADCREVLSCYSNWIIN